MKKTAIADVQKDILLVFNDLSDLQGYPFNITMFKRDLTATPSRGGMPGYEGLDGFVIKTIIENMNITPYYVIPEDNITFGIAYKNGKITGTLGEIVRKKSQLAGNSRFLTDYNTSQIEFTNTLYSERICVVIPKYSQIPRDFMILRIFKPSTWCMIFLIIVLYMIIIYLRYVLRLPSGSNSNEVLKVFGLLIAAPVNFKAEKKQYLVLMFGMIFSVIISGIIQGSLIKSFTTVSYYDDIDTLDELANSNLLILTSLDVFDKDESIIGRKLYHKKISSGSEVKDEGIATLSDVCLFKNISTIARQSEITYVKYNVYLAPDGTRCLHAVKEFLLTYFVVYIVPLHSPFLFKINDIIEKLRESGFIQYWFKNVYSRKKASHTKQSYYHPTSLKDVTVPFEILFLGYILCIIVFIYEILSGKKKLKPRKRFKNRTQTSI